MSYGVESAQTPPPRGVLVNSMFAKRKIFASRWGPSAGILASQEWGTQCFLES